MLNAALIPLFQYIDLNKIVAQNNDCIMIRVAGTPDDNVPVLPGDWVMLDRSLTPQPGHVVLVKHGDEYTIQRYSTAIELRRLQIVKDGFTPDCSEVLGVITMVIHPMN